MYKNFSPFTVICVVIIVVVVIVTILATAVPSVIKMRNMLDNRTNYMLLLEDSDLPLH